MAVSLTSIDIPNSVTSVHSQAFYGCSSLATVTMGIGIKTILSYCFCKCPNLADVYCYAEKVPDTESNTFQDSYIEYAKLHVPESSVEAYKAAEPWKGFKEIVKIMPIFSLTYIVDDVIYKSYQVEEDATITPETEPTKEGYTFSGWSEIPQTMPAHNVTVAGSFNINSYKLTYMIDDKVYKETMYEYGATITPEPQPEGDYATFEWTDLPQTMPAHEVVVYASYTSGIAEVLMTSHHNLRIYSPNGTKISKLKKGLNIIILDDGIVNKVIVKKEIITK